MNKISKILIPFNCKESALNALRYAIAFSDNERETQIKLINIILSGETQPEEEIESQISEIVDDFNAKHAHRNITYEIRKGDIVEQTLAAKEEFGADIILMGTKGIAEKIELRSTNTAKLVHEAECPVLVVPKSFDTFKLNHITLAIDKSEIERPDLLTVLLVIARRFNAKIHVLTIYDEDDEDFFKERQNESTLRYYFQRYYDTGSNIKSSRIADSIIEYDRQQSIDMLAMIPKNHEKSQIPSEGKLTQYLTMHSNIPLLIID